MSAPVHVLAVMDGDIVGIDTDGCAILWNADTQRGENSGENPTDEERAALARAKGGAA